jgi:hypothetical protein
MRGLRAERRAQRIRHPERLFEAPVAKVPLFPSVVPGFFAEFILSEVDGLRTTVVFPVAHAADSLS